VNVFIGLGSNQGDRLENLTRAAIRLRSLSRDGFLKASPVFENPPLLPPGAPASWRLNFLNAVVHIRWSGPPADLLKALQLIEMELGRVREARWAPRTIDLDFLEMTGVTLESRDLKLPHPEINKRQFVLTPLKHLGHMGALARSRALKEQLPMWMGIMNFTPDSFSDGGELENMGFFEERVTEWEKQGVHVFDLGAESTRPGAQTLTEEEEWRRLEPALLILRSRNNGNIFRPLVSVDTYHAKTAERAIEIGADIVNDVSGLQDPRMLEILKCSQCQYVLMHSKSVPAKAGDHWEVEDPVRALKDWALDKLEKLEREGVSLHRVILDPGIGFGKSAQQSLEILRRMDELLDLPVRVLIGHSRKSFMNIWGRRPAAERDPETLAVSIQLAQRGADILRVHRADAQVRAWRAYQEVSV
jgi:2-amino-4-hydroxy-6-hydroxymethyldihydropteridine diphosphokinase/dihydropteroate synthase